MRLTFAAIALAALLAAPAQAAPDNSKLAHRLVDDLAGGPDFAADFTQNVLIGFDAIAKTGAVHDAAGHRTAFVEALSTSKPDMAELEDLLAEVYATNLSADEMSGWAAFLESPAGQAIQLKTLQAGPEGQPDLTQAETGAQAAFDASPVGRSIAGKTGVIQAQTARLTSAFNAELAERAQAIYCQNADSCASQ